MKEIHMLRLELVVKIAEALFWIGLLVALITLMLYIRSLDKEPTTHDHVIDQTTESIRHTRWIYEDSADYHRVLGYQFVVWRGFVNGLHEWTETPDTLGSPEEWRIPLVWDGYDEVYISYNIYLDDDREWKKSSFIGDTHSSTWEPGDSLYITDYSMLTNKKPLDSEIWNSYDSIDISTFMGPHSYGSLRTWYYSEDTECDTPSNGGTGMDIRAYIK